jgi:hypothetical protein
VGYGDGQYFGYNRTAPPAVPSTDQIVFIEAEILKVGDRLLPCAPMHTYKLLVKFDYDRQTMLHLEKQCEELRAVVQGNY